MLRMYAVKLRLTVVPRQACHVMSVCLSKVDTSEACSGIHGQNRGAQGLKQVCKGRHATVDGAPGCTKKAQIG